MVAVVTESTFTQETGFKFSKDELTDFIVTIYDDSLKKYKDDVPVAYETLFNDLNKSLVAFMFSSN